MRIHSRNGNAFSLVKRCAAATLIVAISCSDNPILPPEPPVAALVTVSAPAHALASYGDTTRLIAVVKDAEGNVIEDAEVEWSSSQPQIVSVDATGLATAVSAGTAVITATSGDIEGVAPVTVFQVVRSIEASPASTQLASFGDSVRFSAILRDARGAEVVGRDIIWSSLNRNTVFMSGAAGIGIAVGNGTTGIVVRAGEVEDTVQVTVSQVPVAFHMDALPDLFPGLSLTPRAGMVDARGNYIQGLAQDFELQSLDNTIASITADRRIRAVRTGTVVIRARSGSLAFERTLRVTGVLGGVLAENLDVDLDTIWVTRELSVPTGVTLRLPAGLVVIFDAGVGITVSGTLIAQGAPGDSIRFVSGQTSPAAGDWAGLRLASSTVLDASGNYVSGTIVSHAVITHGGGIWVSASTLIANNRIEANLPKRSGAPFGAVGISAGDPLIRFNRIVNNRASGVHSSAAGRILRNTISGNLGAYMGSWHGGGLTLIGSTAVVEDNVITGNTSEFMGGGIMFQNGSPVIRYNDITSNLLTGPPNNGAGIGKNFFDANATIEYNNIEQNSCSTSDGCAAIFVTNGAFGTLRNNNIVNPGPYELYLHSGASTLSLTAEANYWGTTSESSIGARIWDRADNGTLAAVAYAPAQTSRVTGAGPRP